MLHLENVLFSVFVLENDHVRRADVVSYVVSSSWMYSIVPDLEHLCFKSENSVVMDDDRCIASASPRSQFVFLLLLRQSLQVQ